MKRTGVVLVVGLTAILCGCSSSTGGKDTNKPQGTGDCENTCTRSSECAVGEICTDKCCAKWEGCTNDEGCGAAQICNPETFECVGREEICQTAGCACYIVNDVGQLEAGSQTPTLTLAPGASADIRVVVTVKDNGLPLSGLSYSLSGPDGDLPVTYAGTKVTAKSGVARGQVTLTATVKDSTGAVLDPAVSCEAKIINLGDRAANTLRVRVYNDMTGGPVAGAAVVLDSGTGPGAPLSTDANGIVTLAMPASAYTVSVFQDGYNYLSVVGLTAAEVALPLSPRQAGKVSGFTGRYDFKGYERRNFDSKPQLFSAGVASASVPLRALLNFDLSVFVGQLPQGECTSATQQGCYELRLPGFESKPQIIPLPGGLTLGVGGTKPVKEYFAAVGVPGRRYAWSLAGEAGIKDIGNLIPTLFELMTCDCDTDKLVCDAGCDCDTKCEGVEKNIDFGQLITQIMPLLPNFASGVKGNLPLLPTDEAEWKAYASGAGPYAQNANYPTLDDTTDFRRLTVLESMSNFVDFAAPALPADPLANVPGATDIKMEGMIMLTGVDMAGFGYVPLGLAAGLDCTEGDCLKRTGDGAGKFDGVLNGITLASGAVSKIDPGHLGLFYAPAHSGLAAGKWVSVVAALPLSAFAMEASRQIRATALVLRDKPQPGQSNALLNRSFPALPPFPAKATENSYTVAAGQGDLHWLTFSSDDVPGSISYRWNVYFGAAGGTFTAPTRPGGWDAEHPNPLAATDKDKVAAGEEINVTHIVFDLPASAGGLESYLGESGRTLSSLVDDVDGFGVANKNVCATNCP